jgi:hypothetical protein
LKFGELRIDTIYPDVQLIQHFIGFVGN